MESLAFEPRPHLSLSLFFCLRLRPNLLHVSVAHFPCKADGLGVDPGFKTNWTPMILCEKTESSSYIFWQWKIVKTTRTETVARSLSVAKINWSSKSSAHVASQRRIESEPKHSMYSTEYLYDIVCLHYMDPFQPPRFTVGKYAIHGMECLGKIAGC